MSTQNQPTASAKSAAHTPQWKKLFRAFSNAHFKSSADEYREGASDASVKRNYDASLSAENAFTASVEALDSRNARLEEEHAILVAALETAHKQRREEAAEHSKTIDELRALKTEHAALLAERDRLRDALEDIECEAAGALNNAMPEDAPGIIEAIQSKAADALKTLANTGPSEADRLRESNALLLAQCEAARDYFMARNLGDTAQALLSDLVATLQRAKAAQS